jgi:4-hydroxy-3-methylbut-2-enyl diphosphate reductase
LNTDADLAIVVGGYNSSNTSHLVELCEKKFPTYFISSANEISTDGKSIQHWDFRKKELLNTKDFLPAKTPLKIVITSGASCPDSLLEEVITKINSLRNVNKVVDEVVNKVRIYKN